MAARHVSNSKSSIAMTSHVRFIVRSAAGLRKIQMDNRKYTVQKLACKKEGDVHRTPPYGLEFVIIEKPDSAISPKVGDLVNAHSIDTMVSNGCVVLCLPCDFLASNDAPKQEAK